MMKKFLVLSIIAIVFTCSSPVLAADYGLKETGGKLGYNTAKGETIYTIVNRVVSVFLGALAIIFFGLMLYAGIRWMTARGNEDLAEKAKHTLEAAAIGMIIIVASYAITAFIFSKLPGGG